MSVGKALRLLHEQRPVERWVPAFAGKVKIDLELGRIPPDFFTSSEKDDTPGIHFMDESSALARRYGQTAAGEWQRVLNHFALGEGFALIILVVPDRDGAQLCRNELERLLAA